MTRMPASLTLAEDGFAECWSSVGARVLATRKVCAVCVRQNTPRYGEKTEEKLRNMETLYIFAVLKQRL